MNSVSWVFAHRLAFPAIHSWEGQISILELAAETLSSFFVVLFPGLVEAGETAQSAAFPWSYVIHLPLSALSLFVPSAGHLLSIGLFKGVCAKAQSLSPVIRQTPTPYFSPGDLVLR